MIAWNESRTDSTHPPHAFDDRLRVAFQSLTPGSEPLIDDGRSAEQRAQARVPIRALRSRRELTEGEGEVRIRLLHRPEQALDQIDIAFFGGSESQLLAHAAEESVVELRH